MVVWPRLYLDPSNDNDVLNLNDRGEFRTRDTMSMR
jgi:hypothetical protein